MKKDPRSTPREAPVNPPSESFRVGDMAKFYWRQEHSYGRVEAICGENLTVKLHSGGRVQVRAEFAANTTLRVEV